MAIKRKYGITTIVKQPNFDNEAEFDDSDVSDWLDHAPASDIQALGLIRINCGQNTINQFDLAQIQELCNTMHVSDILEKLRA